MAVEGHRKGWTSRARLSGTGFAAADPGRTGRRVGNRFVRTGRDFAAGTAGFGMGWPEGRSEGWPVGWRSQRGACSSGRHPGRGAAGRGSLVGAWAEL